MRGKKRSDAMIRHLRVKFVLICMLLVTLVLSAVFAAMFTATRQNIYDSSLEVLERVIGRDGSLGRPSWGDGAVQMPYFTVKLIGSTAYITGGTYSDLENTAELEEIIRLALDSGETVGEVEGYGLRFLIRGAGLYRQMAFVDLSVERTILRDLVGSLLAIGVASLAGLLAVSCALAWWATRPVEKSLRQQKQFLSDASHELKTPLTVILSNAEMLAGEGLEGRSGRWVDNIRSEAGRMRTLVEEMLTLARSDNMTQTMVMTRQDLGAIVTDCVLSFEPVAFEQGKALVWEQPEEIFVTGDGERLRRLVGILVDNAVKYGAAGAPVRVSLRREDRRARLEVANQGSPIPKEQLDRLFERFYRADTSRGEQSGFGLGLPIAAVIVREHRGAIRAESDETATRFIVTLPLEKGGGETKA